MSHPTTAEPDTDAPPALRHADVPPLPVKTPRSPGAASLIGVTLGLLVLRLGVTGVEVETGSSRRCSSQGS